MYARDELSTVKIFSSSSDNKRFEILTMREILILLNLRNHQSANDKIYLYGKVALNQTTNY